MGWRAVFYAAGAISAIWCVAWEYLVFENPREDPHISSTELMYIEKSIGAALSPKKVCNVSKPRYSVSRVCFSMRVLYFTATSTVVENFHLRTGHCQHFGQYRSDVDDVYLLNIRSYLFERNTRISFVSGWYSSDTHPILHH